MKLSIIVLTQNEKGLILKTLRKLKESVKTHHEILVVDDSTYGAAKMVKAYSKERQDIPGFIPGS